MPGREYQAQPSRFGFNGKENDNDVKGFGNQQDYGMRIYDTRLGRFLSVDPLASSYPSISTYSFAENDPINFIDLDGLERAIPNPPGGSSRPGRVVPHYIHAAEQANQMLREGARQARERELLRHRRLLARSPQYRQTVQTFEQFSQSYQKDSYIQNALNSAQLVFAGGGVRENNRIGNKWDDLVYQQMLKNPDYVGVARQVSIKVTGMVNGKLTEANIRVDNVGVVINPVTKQPMFDFKEAKFSIQQITMNNVLQMLTPQQRTASTILINGKDVQFFIRGEGSAQKLNIIMGPGYELQNGQSITGQINQINVIVPTVNNSGVPKNNNNNNLNLKDPKASTENNQSSKSNEPPK